MKKNSSQFALIAAAASLLFTFNAVFAEDGHTTDTMRHSAPEVKSELNTTKDGTVSNPDEQQAWQALAALIRGNKRFMEGRAIHPFEDSKRRAELVSGQAPKSVVLSCSDSRVPPELIFDQGLGEIFTVRTAGQVADPVAMGSIEYALDHLNVKLLVILGHDSCGAVNATLSTPEGKSAGSENLDALVSLLRPNLKGYSLNPQDKVQSDASRANVFGVAKSIIGKSKIVRELLEKEKLLIVKGVYHLDSGKVDFSL